MTFSRTTMGFIAFYLITLPPGTAAKERTQHLRWQGQTQAEKAAAIRTVKRARVLAMMTSCPYRKFGPTEQDQAQARANGDLKICWVLGFCALLLGPRIKCRTGAKRRSTAALNKHH